MSISLPTNPNQQSIPSTTPSSTTPTPTSTGDAGATASISSVSVASVSQVSVASLSSLAAQSASESALSASTAALSSFSVASVSSASLASESIASVSSASVSSASVASTMSTTITTTNSDGGATTVTQTLGPTSTGASRSSSSNHAGAIAGGVVGGVVGLALLAGLIFFLWRRNRDKEDFDGNFDPSNVGGSPPHVDLPPEDYANHAALTASPGATSAGVAGVGAAAAGMSQYDGSSHVSGGGYGAASSYDHGSQQAYYDANYDPNYYQGGPGPQPSQGNSPNASATPSDPSTYYSNQALQPGNAQYNQGYESYNNAYENPSGGGEGQMSMPQQNHPASLMPGGGSAAGH